MNKRLILSLMISVSLISVVYSADRKGPADDMIQRSKQLLEKLRSGVSKEEVKAFLDAGVDINYRDGVGDNALKIAISKGSPEIVEMLLDRGADVMLQDARGRIASHYAQDRSRSDSRFTKIEERLDRIRQFGGSAESTNDAMIQRSKQLLIVLKRGAIESDVASLLSAGVDINYQDDKGDTALMIASRDVTWDSRHGRVEVSLGYYGVMQMLLKSGADVNMKNKKGETALIDAARYGNLDMVKLLLKNGAAVDKHNNVHSTALIVAAEGMDKRRMPFYYTRIVEELLNSGADVNSQNYYGDTALIVASKNGYTEIVKILLESGADVSLTDNAGHTALEYAVHYGFTKIAEMML